MATTEAAGDAEPRRVAPHTLPQCCCVIINRKGEEVICNSRTTGPDDPFCSSCTDRHPDNFEERVFARFPQG